MTSQTAGTTLCHAADIPPGEMKAFDLDGVPVAVFNVEGEFFATADTCTHEEASLADGCLTDHRIECPLHGSEFDIRTGEAMSLPAVLPVKTYSVSVEDEQIVVTPVQPD